ncbi:SsrA-binding protein SmpB [Candidatus Parcubacteria bacterium]|nr:SsrA-binding protein SmpB [Patescibacteria group bacterium]MBU4380643.1 SsrA-binding protein SmpB [Patescibacteria group bacterium]MCG2689560.1 SsrA-binding protein SmpB [Candidatus Parcubacteria bacterium]
MPVIAENKKAYFEYFIEKEFEAGLKLLGHEVKACRLQGASLVGSFVRVVKNEAFVINVLIPVYKKAGGSVVGLYDPKRSRKLLLHKGEINAIIGAQSRKGYAIVPLKLYTEGDLIKIKIGIGRGKKLYDKREELKKRQIQREMMREAKE